MSGWNVIGSVGFVLFAAATFRCSGASAKAQSASSPEAYRARADSVVNLEPSLAVLSLQAETPRSEWWSFEGALWGAMGDALGLPSKSGQTEADIVVLNFRVRDETRTVEARGGRFFLTPGALLPVHLDGVATSVRLPLAFTLESFAGIPVRREFDIRAYDWTAGARLSRDFGTSARIGFAYAQSREEGSLANEEIGVDALAFVGRFFDLHAKAAFDLVDAGISSASGTVVHRHRSTRRGAASPMWSLGAFATHTSAARILPSTSLFSVLGDAESSRVGLSASWRAFPRLEFDGRAGARNAGAEWGPSLEVGSELALDDAGRSSVRLVGFRDQSDSAGWTGARVALHFRFWRTFRITAKGELSVRDEDSGRGQYWPYGALSVAWFPARAWQLAAGIEASSSPEYESHVTGLLRAAYLWESSP